MEATWAAVYVGALGMQAGLIWFAIKTYIDLRDVSGENRRLKEKIEELKEWIRNSK